MEGGLRLSFCVTPLKRSGGRVFPAKLRPALAQAQRPCKPWQARAGSGRPCQALAGSAGSGRLWQALAGPGRVWQALGRLWQALAGSEKPGCGGPVLFLGVTRFFVGFKGIIIFMRLYAS